MCYFFSGITDRDGKHYVGKNGEQSHTEIEIQHGLKDDGHEDYIKWEFRPLKRLAKTLTDFDNYKFVIDEDRTPDWWNAGYQADAIEFAKTEITRQIQIGKCHNWEIIGLEKLTELPETITEIGKLCGIPLLKKLPEGLEKLPEGITKCRELGYLHRLTELPEGLKEFNVLYHLPLLKKLPEGLTQCGDMWNLPLLEKLPKGLKECGNLGFLPLIKELPEGLTKCGDLYNLPLIKKLPDGLTKCGDLHDLPLLEKLPEGLKHGKIFNCPKLKPTQG